jgi:uncharacterized membrane protein
MTLTDYAEDHLRSRLANAVLRRLTLTQDETTVLNTISWNLCLPYAAALITLIIGVTRIAKETSNVQGIEKIITLGPLFLAVSMAVFGMDHLVFYDSVVLLIPSWIPWHLFWALFVGLCLLAGAVSLALHRYAILAAALFAAMLFLFVLLMHIPKVLQAPHDRFAWAIALRDLAFAACALSFAAAQAPERLKRFAGNVLTPARGVIGVAVIYFSVEHFLHPEFRPGVPLKHLTPFWIPARVAIAYLTGVILLIAGLAFISNRHTRLAAVGLGAVIFLLVLVVYVPIVIAKPAAIGSGLNALADTLLFSGSILCFAASQRCTPPSECGCARSVGQRREFVNRYRGGQKHRSAAKPQVRLPLCGESISSCGPDRRSRSPLQSCTGGRTLL